MKRSTLVLILTLLAILAFAARIGTVVHFKAWQKPNAMEHRSVALSLVNGTGFSFGDWGYYGPSSVQSPPFPFLLATSIKLFVHQHPVTNDSPGMDKAYFALMALNSVAGAVLVLLTYSMVRTLGGTELAGILAALAVAIWPSQVYSARAAQAISLITCCLIAMIVLFYKSVRTGKAGPWVAYSFIGTVAALTEPVILPALAISGVMILLWRKLEWRLRFRNAGILILATIIVIGPWSMRNFIVHGKWVPVKNTFWVNFWKGNNDFATGSDRLALTTAEKKSARTKLAAGDEDVPDGEHQYEMLDPSQKSRLHHQPEIVREAIFKEFSTNWVRDNPQKYVRLCVIRLVKTLTIDWDNPRTFNFVYRASRAILLLLTVVGLVTIIRQKWALLFPGLLVMTALVTYTLTVTAARFSIPFEPLQLAMGAAAIAAFFEKRRAPVQGFPIQPVTVNGTPAPVREPVLTAATAAAR